MLVVHGSALTGANPRDIDVVHTGEWTAAMEQAVRDWAAGRGLPSGLPVDAVQARPLGGGYGYGEVIHVPVPCETDCAQFEIIDAGPYRVAKSVFKDFTSGIRAYGLDAELFLRHLADGDFGGEVSLIPASVRPDYGPRFGVPWDKYCAGTVALRSAIRHAPAWGEICDRLGEGGRLLARLAAGEEPTRNWQAAPNSPDGVKGHGDGWSQAVSLKVRASGVWTVAGREFPSADAAAEWLGLR